MLPEVWLVHSLRSLEAAKTLEAIQVGRHQAGTGHDSGDDLNVRFQAQG